MCADIVRNGVDAFVELVPPLALQVISRDPLAWTRLEPQTLSGEPGQALAAPVHDPLWMLGRQWQFGEFEGEDAGTPVAVELAATARRMTAFAPNGLPGRAIGPRDLIEPEVEAEPAGGATLRQRAEAGARLAAVLHDAGADLRPALVAACPLPVPVDAGPAAPVSPLWRLVAREAIDGSAAAAQIQNESFTGSWAVGAAVEVVAAARDWLGWYRANVEPTDAPGDCWQPERLEYRFAVRAGGAGDQRVCSAAAHDGGAVDWYSFDHAADAKILLDAEPAGEAVVPLAATVHATRLRYAGMPAPRFWQCEDGLVNFDMVEVQPHDLTRVAFLDFATAHADDWLVAPLDVPRGTLVEMQSVFYRTTFNEKFEVTQGNTGSDDFELFSLDATSGGPLRALLVPPGGRTATEGAAVEEVVFARDETANMVWAIEKLVEGPVGDPRERRLETRPIDEFLTPAEADLTYRLEKDVPEWWIPMVPVADGKKGGFHLRKGSFTDTDSSRGRILAATPFDMFEEEVSREGVIVRRVPSLIRDNQGHLRRWIARRVSVARGEPSSGLGWDSAVRR